MKEPIPGCCSSHSTVRKTMSNESLIDEFAASHDDLDDDLAEAYKEAMDASEDEAADQLRARLDDILDERLQTDQEA